MPDIKKPFPPAASVPDAPESVEGSSSPEPSPVESGDTFESPPPSASSFFVREGSQHRDYNAEVAILRSLGYEVDALTSETLIAEFLLAKAEKIDKPGFNYKRLSHKVKLKLGSTREEAKALLIEAARDASLSQVLPAVCHEHTTFSVGGAQLSRLEIKRTIEIISQMESIIIKGLTAALTHTFSPKKGRGTKTPLSIPRPDGTHKTMLMHNPGDVEMSVKERFLTPEAQNALLQLARQLPSPRTSDGGSKWSFRQEAIQLLKQDNAIPFHEVRRLLPVTESGSLGGDVSDVKLEGQTSLELKKVGLRIGALAEDD
jgi:hypothetical protein